MKSQLHSLLYKKYSLLPIQVYLLFQLVLVIIISLLGGILVTRYAKSLNNKAISESNAANEP